MESPSGKMEEKEGFGPNYVFKRDIAKEYGVEEAILIQHFIYSISHHKRNGTHFYEGKYWAYDSVANLTEIYPFWSVKTITLIINRLVDKNVLLPGNFNKNKFDRTRWFSFHDEERFILPVDKFVDKCKKPVDNPVQNYGIKNKNHGEKNVGKEPLFSEKRLETPGKPDLSKKTNRFVPKGKSILSIYPSIYNSSEEVGTANNYNRGNLENFHLKGNNSQNSHRGKSGLRSLSLVVESQFIGKITNNYKLSSSLRKKIQELGFSDGEIDGEILNMIQYHETKPQRVLNEHSCVLGWFRNHLKRKAHRRL